jgi:hypothetical protein
MFIILCGYYFLNLCFGISLSCLFYKITGYYCPGCGITRCLFAIINGDFYRAYCYNRLVFMMLPFIAFYVIYNIYLYVMDKKDNIINKIPNYVWYVLLFIVILFGIVRNIDF